MVLWSSEEGLFLFAAAAAAAAAPVKQAGLAAHHYRGYLSGWPDFLLSLHLHAFTGVFVSVSGVVHSAKVPVT